MLFGRKDYDKLFNVSAAAQRLSKKANPIADDEPVFLIRGTDRNAVEVLKCYKRFIMHSVDLAGMPKAVVLWSLGHQIRLFEAWQKAHPDKVKWPDLPQELDQYAVRSKGVYED